MKFAHEDRIDTRWYYGFIIHEDNTITVALHDCLSRYNDRHPVSLGEYKAIESPGRILEALIINGKKYMVTNPGHVFSYPKFSGEIPVRPTTAQSTARI